MGDEFYPGFQPRFIGSGGQKQSLGDSEAQQVGMWSANAGAWEWWTTASVALVSHPWEIERPQKATHQMLKTSSD